MAQGEIVPRPSPFDGLPEDCISNIISFTNPRDACVAASVSKAFESAVQSDSVWEKFLPRDYSSLVPQSRVFLSKKDLFFSLCHDPLLIEDGKKSFWLDKTSGEKCIMLSPKEMVITEVNSPRFWRWTSLSEARFEEVPELLYDCWFEVCGAMSTHYLSPRTRYSVYIVFKSMDLNPRLVRQEPFERFISFVGPMDRRCEREWTCVTSPEEREDGWMEAELCEFFNEASCGDVKVSVFGIKSPYWKPGLIIQGIEFRPTKSS